MSRAPITARLSPRHWRTLRALSAKHGKPVSVVFDEILRQAARSAEIADDEVEDGDEAADAEDVAAGTAAAMKAIEAGALETGDPDEAVADAVASAEEADNDEDLPPGRRGRRPSPLTVWARRAR